jgi:hypothetical protein
MSRLTAGVNKSLHEAFKIMVGRGSRGLKIRRLGGGANGIRISKKTIDAGLSRESRLTREG